MQVDSSIDNADQLEGAESRPKKKLKILKLKQKEDNQSRSSRVDAIRKQTEEEVRKLLKEEFDQLSQKIQSQENTIEQLKFELKFNKSQLKTNKKEIRSLNYS